VMMVTPGETKSGGIAGLFAPKSKNGRGRELVFGTPIQELEDFLIGSFHDRRATPGGRHFLPGREAAPGVPANCTVTGPVIGASPAGLEPRLARS
ncbi:MAG: hypothetical protein ACJ8IK_12580, partial [Burkholderiaceae bacterium]